MKTINKDDTFLVSNNKDFSKPENRYATGLFNVDGDPLFYPPVHSSATYCQGVYHTFKYYKKACSNCGKPIDALCGCLSVAKPKPDYLHEYNKVDDSEVEFLADQVLIDVIRGRKTK